MSCRPIDYALIYRLEDARAARERAYICPMRDWIMDFVDRWRDEHWWTDIPRKNGFNGEMTVDDDEDPLRYVNECHGEIVNDVMLDAF